MAAALATALGFIRLYRLPWGGSLSLKILPLLYLAVWRGPRAGAAGGLITGLVTLAIDPVILHPVQVLLDYIAPYLAIGLAGWFGRMPRTGILIVSIVRLASHVISGVVFFAAYAPPELNTQTYRFLEDFLGLSVPFLLRDSAAPWLYSFLYNGSLIVPETVIMVLLLPSLLKRLERILS